MNLLSPSLSAAPSGREGARRAGEEAPSRFMAAMRIQLWKLNLPMRGELSIRNRQRMRTVDTRRLRDLTLSLLHEELPCAHFEVCVHLVTAKEMTRINETFLRHQGSTDVITFDQSERTGAKGVFGEIFVCLDDAVAQARRFRTTWQDELARYVVHGLLHLSGYDDLDPVARRKMKREENRLVRRLSTRVALRRLGKSKPRPR